MLISIDLFFTNFIFNLPHNLILNYFFGFFSIRGMQVLIWFSIFLYLIIFEEKKHKEFIIFFLTSLIISSILVNVVIKNLVCRPRPNSAISNQRSVISNRQQTDQLKTDKLITDYPTDFSFPSGHAATSFTAATILAYFDKKRKKLFYLIAVLIAFSRVYLGYHYFLDVIVGAMLGYLISKFILLFYVKHAKQRKTMR